MFIPDTIRQHLPAAAFTTDDLGRSGAQVMLFDDCVLKIEGDCNMSANERRMMSWLQGKLNVPRIIAADCVNDMRYLLMTRLPGRSLCDEAILDDQEKLAELVADGLRQLWSVSTADCPADRSLDQKFREIEAGLRAGTITREQSCQLETYGSEGFASPAQLFDWLVRYRPEEEPVLSHGDYCLPNVFTGDAGIVGFLDLGQAGVADKWLDIEKGLWSMWANTTGQFGGKQRPFDRKLLFNALGMQPDEDKLRYYSLLDELA